MFSNQDKRNCRTILKTLSDDDIFSLMRTVTNNVVDTTDRREAISAILNFTQSVDEFFRRRKINKDLLLTYIYKQGWHVPRDYDLQALQRYIQEQWKKSDNGKSGACSNDTGVRTKATGLASSKPVKDRAPLHMHVVKNYTSTRIVNYTVNIHNHIQSPAAASSQQSTSNNNEEQLFGAAASSQQSTSNNNEEQRFGAAFAKWFYSLLNSCNPDLNQTPGDFGPHHFWRDAQLHLKMEIGEQHNSESFLGNEAVAGKLRSFPAVDHLLFNPTFKAEGLRTRTDLLGRKVISVCGLVHKSNACVGTFCQSFGLVSDPAQNNAYKVQVMLLKMIESRVQILSKEMYDAAAGLEDRIVSALQAIQ